MMTLSEIAEAIGRIFQNFSVALQDAIEPFSRLFDSTLGSQSLVWTPYRCRMCGRRYTTPQEVRICAKRHQTWRSSASAGGRAYGKYAGAHVTPRNREATMRTTEIRRQKLSRNQGGRKV